MLRRRVDTAFIPSPRRGEGRGEGWFSQMTSIEASFDGYQRKTDPLTSILSPQGRGGERNELFLP